MLRIEMLPAEQGDALWIEYGAANKPRRFLIDGGTGASWDDGLRARIERQPADERHFELLIVTHIDADHIDGALKLLQDEELGATFGEVWFNGWRHLPDTGLEELGPVAGEELTDTIVGRDLPWNKAFGKRAVGVNPGGDLPRKELDGDLFLTVLSPTATQLAKLKPKWKTVVEKAGLVPGETREPTPPEEPPSGLEHLGAAQLPDVHALADEPLDEDGAEANGTSIVVLLEHDDRSVMLCGDAFPSVVEAAVDRLLVARDVDRLELNAFKLPHHGSAFNNSKTLLAKLACPLFLFSTNGAHTKHPHPESVARVLVTAEPGASLLFNYRTGFNEVWDEQELRDEFHYTPTYPAQGTKGLTVDL